MTKPFIVIADDEPQIRKMLRVTLEAADFRVEEAENGKNALKMVSSLKPDLLLLDLGLPDMDGTDVIAAIRQFSKMPILVLSIRGYDRDIVGAFDRGADDYVVKPFSVDVLIARIRAALRKSSQDGQPEAELRVGDLSVNFMKRKVSSHGRPVKLSPKEYNLLTYMMRNRGRMLTHQQLLREIWGKAHVDDTQYLRVYVGQLRKKIEPDPENPVYIITESGIGYRLDSPEENVSHQRAARG